MRIRLEGEPPDATERQAGCIFRSRCWKAAELCAVESPPLVQGGPNHSSACHFPENVTAAADRPAAALVTT